MKNIEINNIIYNIPENFDEISFGDFEKLLIIMEEHPSSPLITHDLVLDIIEFLIKIPKDVMLADYMPKEIYQYIYSTINFVFFQENLKDIKLKSEYIINNERWVYSDDPNCSTKEYIDRDTILTDFPKDNQLSGIISIFLRPVGKKYDAVDLNDRIALIKKEKVTEIYPLVAFFLTKKELLKTSMNLYSIMLASFQAKQAELQSYLESGDGTGSLLNWRKKICLSLMKSLNDRFMKSSTYYHTLKTRV